MRIDAKLQVTAQRNSKSRGRRPFKVLVAMVVRYDGWPIRVFSRMSNNSGEVDLMTSERTVW